MINLDVEVARHLAHGNYPALRAAGVTAELFNLDTDVPEEQDDLIWTKSVFQFVADNHPVSVAVLSNEFPNFVVDDEPLLEEPETEATYLADKLKKRYVKYYQRKQLFELAEASPEEFAQVYVTGSRRIYQLMASNDQTVDGSNVDNIVDYQKNRIKEGKTLGVSFGFDRIDEHTGGIRPGHLAILAALPKRMKTWNLLTAWVAQARAGGRPILFNQELSNEDTVGRILCMLAGDVSYTRYYRGELLPNEWAKIERAAEEYRSLGGVVTKLHFGNTFVSSMILEADKHDATCVLVDQFSYLQPVREYFRENEAYKEIIYDIKNACNIYDLSWYMAAQLGRQAVAEDEFPIAQHLGLTRAVEEVSDIIMGIKINDALKEEHQIMLGVIESRHCESGPKARWTIEHDLYSRTKFELHEI